MELSSDSGEATVGTQHTVERKTRRRKKSKTKRLLKKEAKYSASDLEMKEWSIPCSHSSKMPFQCSEVRISDLRKAKRIIYQKLDRKEQDRRIALLIEPSMKARIRKRDDNCRKSRQREISNKYRIRTAEKKNLLVCAKFFASVFEIGTRRLNTIAKGKLSGTGVVDKRGGDHVSHNFVSRKESIRNFIRKLKASDSHYGRNKSRRLYLSSELSIAKLHQIYKKEHNSSNDVTYSYFYKIFVTDFNLGFGSPSVDTCSFCDRVVDEMKYHRNRSNFDAMRNLRRQLKLHRIKAKFFFSLMKTSPPNSVTLCFDLQQVHYLPRLTLGETFYKRQLSFYAFCVTDTKIKNARFYTWLETQGKRGAEEIASALIDDLDSRSSEWPEEITKVRLFCDGCPGQNKNQHLVHALSLWLVESAPEHITKIVLHFPVRGHSFLPADRVFGLVEQQLKKQKETLLPEEYESIYAKFGKVQKLNVHWQVRSYKNLSDQMRTTVGIKEVKRVILIKTPKMSVAYRLEVNFEGKDPTKKFTPITKPTMKFNSIMLPPIKSDPIPLAPKKKKDIEDLLKIRFGEKWSERSDIGKFYKDVLSIPAKENDKPSKKKRRTSRKNKDDSEEESCEDENYSVHDSSEDNSSEDENAEHCNCLEEDHDHYI